MVAIAPIPPTTNDIARVPISALIRNRVTITPFASPMTSPTARPASDPDRRPERDASWAAVAPARP